MKNNASSSDSTGMHGWRKSSYSGQNGCVELSGSAPGHIRVRDSKLGADSPILVFDRHEIQAFLRGAKDGEFDHLVG
ncbi:DUF397 domain-containing protein [Amycolatopsis aidingensis]|uniref:DUF397 domain-containing protein n=1 Tax=Amycolatopsis aidingensis TaxID=2842453 RepID=UPI001C0BB55C|nr:DUF397 domain-containing protein [Amycolatopsis aidingensis]